MSIFCWIMVLAVFLNGFPGAASSNTTERPNVVNVGAVLAVGSTVGKVAAIAIEAAVNDVNSDTSFLKGTNIQIKIQDSNRSGFMGIIETLKFMESDTVAIIGPQSSVTAHVVSHLATELQVPLMSYSATDPTLSPLQFPYFVRTSQSDLFQMTAIAEIVNYYEWKEVIAIYGDDDYGRNGIATLSDKLSQRRCKISYKAPLSPLASRAEITDVLVKVALTESRILVVHTNAPWITELFNVAQYLGMMGTGYVWIATNWLTTLLDTESTLPEETKEDIQGVISLRMYTPNSEVKKKFVSRWSNLTESRGYRSMGLSTYGLYAYDTVWMLARAIDAFFDSGGNISFSNDTGLVEMRGNLNLDALSIFDGGNLLLEKIRQVTMTGLTGPIKFTSDGNLINPAYEIVNIIGKSYRRIGYWSNYSGLSVVPPETLYSKPLNRFSSGQKLFTVIWPGQGTQKPRGWVFPNNGQHLRIGVPNRVSYREFVSEVPGTEMFTGYCIDVFTAAVNLLPYAVPYKFIPYGDNHDNPSCTELVSLITAGVYDAAVGDIAIITDRTRMVDFTQPYVESGLVVVAPVKKQDSNAWAFLRPFTPLMWGVTAAFFLVVGVVVWILEHRMNDEFRGPPRRQLITILWFSFSTWFFSHRENTVSALGRLVLLIWLFVVLIINSSYTASLTSILTVQQLYSPIKGIYSLQSSKDPIGYQQGSFARDYLVNELHIDESRLVALKTAEDFHKALENGPKKGGVSAVVDERAYVELFLSTRCNFSIVGEEFTKNGWGFVKCIHCLRYVCFVLPMHRGLILFLAVDQAFPRDSPLAVDMSTAILKLSENGDLQRIHDKWLMRSACSYQGAKLDVERLPLRSFWGLYLICGLACFLALLAYFMRIMCKFSRHHSQELASSGRSSASTRIQTFLTFVDEKEEEVKRRSKRRQLEISDSSSSTKRQVEFSSSINHSTSNRV